MNIKNVTTCKYSVENRLAAVYDGCSLLMASAYDGDGNRVFQLNYNPCNDNWRWDGCWDKWHGDGEWWNDCHEDDYDNKYDDCRDDDWNDSLDKDECSDRNDSADKNKQDDGKEDWSDKESDREDENKSEGKNESEKLSASVSTPDINTFGGDKGGDGKDSDHNADGKNYGNDWNYDDRNRCDILFPIRDEDDGKGHKFVGDIWHEGKHHNYELIEYINDVNREYTEVLVEENFGGWCDTSYVYGVDRLSFDYYKGHSGYYLYDGRGSVTSITNEWGFVVQSYRYNVSGELTFGEARYDNEYTYNGESYNPNIESQYLRARYYDVVTASFLTEDSYLGDINEPLTLNRYNYCVSSPLNYQDPSGNEKLVISGGIDDGASFKYQFIEPALLDINNMIEQGVEPTDVTWIVFEAGYNNGENSDLQKFESTAEKLGVGLVTISDKMEFVNYINTKNINGCEIAERMQDKITSVSIFAHGLSQRYSGVEENHLGFAYDIANIDETRFNFYQSDISLLDAGAFENAYTMFYSCNAGTDDSSGMSFAQAWSNVTGGTSVGIRNGRTDYSYINTSGNLYTRNKYPDIDLMDYVNKAMELAYNLTNWEFLEPSEMWQEKMDKKEERAILGYAESGSLKYPEITLLGGDLDVLFSDGILERGWTIFEPQN